PLRYRDASFDLVYAFSVFTHLPESLQLAWMGELRRVLRPGGYLLISLHGEGHVTKYPPPPDVLQQYRAGKVAVLRAEDAGQNASMPPPPGGTPGPALGRAFAVWASPPAGARGTPPQDLYLLRSRAAAVARVA